MKHRFSLAAIAFLMAWSQTNGQDDLTGYRTVDKAVKTTIVKAKKDITAAPIPVFLGVNFASGGGGLIIQEVAANSPAAAKGLRAGDRVLTVDGQEIKDDRALQTLLESKKPGDELTVGLNRGKDQLEIRATLKPISLPKTLAGQAIQGVGASPTKDGNGGAKLPANPDAPPEPKKKGQGGFDTRMSGNWTKPVYNLAVICVEYPDQKHNPKITSQAWEDSLFSTGTYTKTSVTGQQVHGSVNDLYLEQSFGKLKVQGKVFDFVEVSKNRNDYAAGNKNIFFNEAVEKLLARDGKDALAKFDGVFFLHAGAKVPNSPRGGLYWPHRGSFTSAGKRWSYFICPEGGERMANISVFAHEFGHMLSLPDLYARPENPGMEGLGQWSLMSNQVGNGRPQHMCAWCKERLGWIQPTLIDPTVKQKLILAPIEDSPKECYKVLIQRDGSEYLLLENRAKKGFDKSLPGEGLLVWRVVRNRPQLEESHGVEGPAGPSSFPAMVPFPSAANDAFTPFTTPSSRAHLDGGRPVYITNIRRIADGRISFQIGYEYQ
jgi:immune inhibitor A